MRIEIDTKHDTKEELAQLANMLRALAGSSSERSVITEKSGNIFEDPSPSGGLMNMFGSNDETSMQKPVTAAAPAAQGGLFSLFNSAKEQPNTQQDVFDAESGQEGPATTAEDLLDDERIIPY
jgi:hypothetical protein